MSNRGRRPVLQPSLPQTLLDEIDESSKNGQGKNNGKTRHRHSRKDARKQDREDKKKRKAEFFSAPPKANPAKRAAPVEHAESPKRKKAKLSAPHPAPASAPTELKPALKKTAATSGYYRKSRLPKLVIEFMLVRALVNFQHVEALVVLVQTREKGERKKRWKNDAERLPAAPSKSGLSSHHTEHATLLQNLFHASTSG
ncbi:hypothetical protein FIBSPDRAFT_901863 [Athelia psychrophila]|uniref:Uncharacterized protein n=1 Tax=Athelia psychrophila TaxID=1759441 RepID=A0A165WJ01_9AGAM|nr:hypothetical protein FIBSPDRAFT_901863 [Fibularhizoctonia sp. CBS 109695]